MKKKPLEQTLVKVIEHLKKKLYCLDIRNDIETGFRILDDSLPKQGLIVLAGVARVGKTAMALDITRRMAVTNKKTVGYISLGESEETLVERIIASESKIPLWKINTGKLQSRDLLLIEMTVGKLLKANIYIDDTASQTLEQVIKSIKKIHKENSANLFIVDYLQLISVDSALKTWKTDTMATLRELAMNLKVPIILILDTSKDILKDVEGNKLRSLRSLGNIDKVSDMIISLNTGYKSDDKGHEASITIDHNRNGLLGKEDVKFDPLSASFN